MAERSPIYSAKYKNQKIGYVEGGVAFDLSGNMRCNYNPNSGHLLEFESGRIVGHVSLAGYFVGSSWAVNELFPMLHANLAPTMATREPANSDPVDTPLSSDAERALEMIQLTLARKSVETDHGAGWFATAEELHPQAETNTTRIPSLNETTPTEPVRPMLSSYPKRPAKRDTADDVATGMREHLAELRKRRPRVVLKYRR
jgi:hypothetical protein